MGIGPVTTTDVEGLANGEISAEKKQVLVGTGSTAVRLGELQPQGRKSMAAADWARGQRPDAGTVLTGDQEGAGAGAGASQREGAAR
jgi:methionyl-tRNA formyltransferase